MVGSIRKHDYDILNLIKEWNDWLDFLETDKGKEMNAQYRKWAHEDHPFFRQGELDQIKPVLEASGIKLRERYRPETPKMVDIERDTVEPTQSKEPAWQEARPIGSILAPFLGKEPNSKGESSLIIK
jgi:hypothetical protein